MDNLLQDSEFYNYFIFVVLLRLMILFATFYLPRMIRDSYFRIGARRNELHILLFFLKSMIAIFVFVATKIPVMRVMSKLI